MPDSLLSVIDPQSPGHPTSQAVTAWERAKKSCENFLRAFDAEQGGPGTPSDDQQDMLRAMLVFACAGLDSSIRHLVRDSAAKMLGRSDNLRKGMESFVKDTLDVSTDGAQLLIDVIGSISPEGEGVLVERYMHRRVGRSLQSHEELMRICEHFDIADKDLRSKINDLKIVFETRNKIIHEMDVNFNVKNRTRTSRKKADMVQYTVNVLTVAAEIIRRTQKKLDS